MIIPICICERPQTDTFCEFTQTFIYHTNKTYLDNGVSHNCSVYTYVILALFWTVLKTRSSFLSLSKRKLTWALWQEGNISTLWKNSTLTVFSFYNISFIELPPIEEDDKMKEDDEWGMKQVQPVSGEEYK